jgi:ABC-type bacteriocin/lantibiotic exporter with double-glycine peptidase domain
MRGFGSTYLSSSKLLKVVGRHRLRCCCSIGARTGHPLLPDAIQKLLYSRKGHGIFASDVERYLKESGFRVFALRGAWSDLREHLAQGRPLIISLEPGNSRAPLHYVVVTGMDWQREAAFVNDPARGKLLRIERAEFEREWLAARNWMLLAVPAPAG